MRISKEQISVLKNNILAFDKNAKIFLFGSRTNDDKRGGDIDILILSNNKLTLEGKAKIRYNFFKVFGEQKLDIIQYTFDDNSNFKKLALSDAIEL